MTLVEDQLPEQILTPEKLREVQALQGTRLSSKAPWETYASEMTIKETPQMEAAIAEYAKHRHDSSSNQNKEELHRQKELADEAAKEYQFIKPQEYEDEGPRVGRVLTHSQFLTMLRKCGLNVWYRQHPHDDKVTLLYSHNPNVEPIVVCFAQKGQTPEYSFCRFDEHGVIINEKRRGWRTVLLKMILAEIIDESTVNRVFGKATGPASARYNTTLYSFRNRGKAWAE